MRSVSTRFGLVFSLLVLSSISNSDMYNVPGSSCAAINPAQAKAMNWTEMGIVNKDTRNLWIMCPLLRKSYSGATGENQTYFSSGIIPFSCGSSACGEANTEEVEIQCIMREYSGGVAKRAKVEKRTLAPGDQVGISYMNWKATDPEASIFNIACLLPPNTGVSTLLTDSTTDSSSTLVTDALADLPTSP